VVGDRRDVAERRVGVADDAVHPPAADEPGERVAVDDGLIGLAVLGAGEGGRRK